MLQHMPVDRFQMCDLLPLRGVLCTQYAVSTSHSGQPAPLHGQDLAHSAHRIHDHVHIVIKTAQGSHYLFITFHDDLEW